MAQNQCLFCRIVNDEIPARKVFEDEHVIAFHDINPQAPTHVLVIPRKHIASVDDISEADVNAIGMTMLRIGQIARNLQLPADGYRVVVNTGAAAGQTVFHIHFHVLGGRDLSWPPG
jgi:histidine triad (HIT) family protein